MKTFLKLIVSQCETEGDNIMEKELLLNLIERDYPQLMSDKELIINIFEESEENGFTPEENILEYANDLFVDTLSADDMVSIYTDGSYNDGSRIFNGVYKYFEYISKFFANSKRIDWVDLYNIISRVYEIGNDVDYKDDDYIYMSSTEDEPEVLDDNDIESEFFISISSSIEYFDMAYRLYQKYGNDDGIIKLWSNHFEDIIELWEKYNSLWEEYNSLDDE